MRFERTTFRLGGGRSILLSYVDNSKYRNDYINTTDGNSQILFQRHIALLYPADLDEDQVDERAEDCGKHE